MLNWKCSCYKNVMAVLVSRPISSLQILSSPLHHVFSTNFKRHCIDLHHNYILKVFVLKIVICTTYFFYQQFSQVIIFKAKRQNCCSESAALGLVLIFYAVPCHCSSLHMSPAWCWETKALLQHNILLKRF